ncbi:MAG TPA: hypothetical protein EYP56_10970 [Planctomycetaceae bacterium]|nr:hypothetical protein [Planctomycetaceae bacterium]HIQ22760.1 hypothetical protein [Planctomycetota bacterium]
MLGADRIFHRRRDQRSIEPLRAKIERFQRLLDRNNRALEMMAEAGESLGGDLLFDSQYLRRLATELSQCVQGIVADLDFITEGSYKGLPEAAARIEAEVAAAIESRPVLREVPYVLWLDQIDRDGDDVVGEKMARLADVGRRLACCIPDGL